ncbi:AAA family ATPase [Nitrosomonas sp. Is35]|uniref:ATP-dependent nuclease n=1 Tax=Nitrosomonas sp. Is35 TaxID=3080534 RepID=UPI00294B3339|nr:AAA family ATPase [Nitrosomonas sp. Is35]MDV6347345.1 AAA family ATPase [Nitrosomonas sp. Is35]
MLAAGLTEDQSVSVLADINSLDSTLRSRLLSRDTSYARFLARLDENSQRSPLLVMNQDDFYNNFPLIWQSVDLFQESFARLFTSYNRAVMLNKLRKVAEEEGEIVSPLSTEEFLRRFGPPPWKIVDEVLEAAKLDFIMRPPNFYDDGPYEARLYDRKRHVELSLHDLSSGERILMSFALCLFHVQTENTSAEFPKALLFDEIDAPLHPSMTKSLLNVIQQVLVEKYKIKIILTTHSPTTVALSPEANIFVMEKDGKPRISSTTKDKALGILTAGVPTLSVDYQNRRQIFVESSHDVTIYDLFYQYSKSKLRPEISLAFIPSGKRTDGSCSEVKSLVDRLSTNGTKTVRGVIDWDKKNKSTDYLFVLGENERYSIENFVFDPVLLGLFLLREKICNPSEFGLNLDFSYLSINTLTCDNIQKIADSIISSISANLIVQPKMDSNQNSTVCFEYANGFSIKVPVYFSLIQGHELEEAIKKTFQQLIKYHQEPKLKVDIIEKVIGDSPGFIPKTIINLFSKLQD